MHSTQNSWTWTTLIYTNVRGVHVLRKHISNCRSQYQNNIISSLLCVFVCVPEIRIAFDVSSTLFLCWTNDRHLRRPSHGTVGRYKSEPTEKKIQTNRILLIKHVIITLLSIRKPIERQWQQTTRQSSTSSSPNEQKLIYIYFSAEFGWLLCLFFILRSRIFSLFCLRVRCQSFVRIISIKKRLKKNKNKAIWS